MSETTAFDRSADRDALQQQMDEYARQGGMISKLDYAGKLVGLEAETPSPRPTAKVLPMPKRAPAPAPVEGFIELDDRPVVQLTPVEVIPEPEVKLRAKVLPFPGRGRPGKPPTLIASPTPIGKPTAPLAAAPEKAKPAPTAKAVDITKALRTLRADAERALAHLNAVFPGCGK